MANAPEGERIAGGAGRARAHPGQSQAAKSVVGIIPCITTGQDDDNTSLLMCAFNGALCYILRTQQGKGAAFTNSYIIVYHKF